MLREEIEEAQDEVKRIDERLSFIWADTKSDDFQGVETESNVAHTCAVRAIRELIQVAAMAKKLSNFAALKQK